VRDRALEDMQSPMMVWKFQDKFVENCYEAQESFRLRARRCAPESRCRKVDAAFSVIHS